MGSRAARDVVLLWLLAVFVVCFWLGVRSWLRPTAVIPWVGLRAAPAGGHPVVLDIAPWSVFLAAGLQPGDRLVRVGEVDLRGTGPLGFYARFVAEVDPRAPAPVVFERAGLRHEATIRAHATGWSQLPISLAFAATALLLAIRAPPSPVVRTVSRTFMLWAISLVSLVTGGVALNYVGLALFGISGFLANPLGLRAVQVFARGAPPTSRGARLGPWIFGLMGPLGVNYFTAFPLRGPTATYLWMAAVMAYPIVMLVLVARAYGAADAVRRRQIRWAAFGFYAALAPPIAIVLVQLLDYLAFGEVERLAALSSASPWFLILVPLSVFLAIARYNMFDVDRLFSAALSYNVVLVMLVAAGFAMVPPLAELSSTLLGVEARIGGAALSLALAVIVVPLYRRLRPQIDRVFFKGRHALENGMAELLATLYASADARALARALGEGVRQLLRPLTAVIYARAGESFEPVFVAGRAVPPGFAADGSLVSILLGRRKPLALSADGRRPDAAALDPFERAALEALHAEVVLPVWRSEALLAFLCLGPQRSGDVYTPTHLSQLAAVAEAVSGQLLRFDLEETIRQAREMQASLRRYVPAAVAEQLASGVEPVSGEREVSVLFVDIRGYTSFAESLPANEIFSTVNRYTEAVSEAVRAHGGAVVEFNGDGMMAVFGAVGDAPHKERAAVGAGRVIVTVVQGVASREPLAVGVGIATGPAFVGSLRAVDRLIWTALGATTNRAARLQALTRELGTSMVIDRPTWEALGSAAADFQVHGSVLLRGHRQPTDVYTRTGVETAAARASRIPSSGAHERSPPRLGAPP